MRGTTKSVPTRGETKPTGGHETGDEPEKTTENETKTNERTTEGGGGRGGVHMTMGATCEKTRMPPGCKSDPLYKEVFL